MLQMVQSVLLGYVLGCINPAIMVSKLKGVNIRNTAYGNPGATNVFMNIGKLLGIFVMLFDVSKAFLAVRLAGKFFPMLRCSRILGGVGAMLGHMFPVTLRFKGGKGTACLGGTILGLNPWLFPVVLALGCVVFLMTGYICTLPMAAAALFPLVYGFASHDFVAGLLLAVSCGAMFWKHQENIQGIFEGKEPCIYHRGTKHSDC